MARVTPVRRVTLTSSLTYNLPIDAFFPVAWLRSRRLAGTACRCRRTSRLHWYSVTRSCRKRYPVKDDRLYVIHISDVWLVIAQYVAGGRETFMNSTLIPGRYVA